MAIIYTDQRSTKTRKQKAKEEQAWLDQCQRDGLMPNGKKFVSMDTIPPPAQHFRDGALDFRKKESLKTDAYDTFRAPDKVYTGTAMKGIATMHKSNAVPVFSDESAKDISKMRRG